MRPAVSATANRMHHFHPVTLMKGELRMLAAGYDVFIDLNREALAGQSHPINQRCDGRAGGKFHRVPINLNLHNLILPLQCSSIRLTTAGFPEAGRCHGRPTHHETDASDRCNRAKPADIGEYQQVETA